MKTILVVLLAVCACGQAASTGAEVEVKGNELVYATADQGIFRIGYLNSGHFMAWFDAQFACIRAGYKGLLSIKSAAAQQAADYALDSFGVIDQTWVGIHRQTAWDPWTWADGTVLGGYTNWYISSTNTTIGGVYLYPFTSTGRWYTATITSVLPGCLCEY